MVSLAALWLPILLSAVIVFIASAIIWTVLPYHRTDHGPISEEDGVMTALRERGVGPGMYVFPWASSAKEAGTDEYKAKVREGPVGILRVKTAESQLSMGPQLVKSFVFYLGVGLFVAYIASRTIPAGEEYMKVFQITSTVTFMTYAGAYFQEGIWFGLRWSAVWKNVFDALVYGLLTAGVFGWLWP